MTHTHLLTLGTGEDREEIRLTQCDDDGTPGAGYLEEDCGTDAAYWDYDFGGWALAYRYDRWDPKHPVTWTIEEL